MKRGQTERALLLLILLAAAFFRFWRLDSVPPGLTHDEANNVHDAAAVLEGVRPFYFPVAQGKEPLYPYSVAALMAVLGRLPWVMRLTSAIWGLITVTMTYAWTRRAFDPATALLTAAGLAIGFWPVSVARMGLRAVVVPALMSASAYFIWRGLDISGSEPLAPKRARLSPFLLAGGALGLCLYTYLAGRLAPVVLLLFGAYLLLFGRECWQQVRSGLVLALLVAAIVALPLFLYLRAHPAAEIRVGQLDRPLRALLDGDPSLLLDRAGEAAGMLSFRGDTFVPYNLPGKPLLDPVMSALFYGGLALAVLRWRRPAYAYAVLWLAAGFSPALVTGLEAANLRAVAAQPVVYVFPALSLVEAGRYAARRLAGPPNRRRTSEAALAVGVVILFSWVGVQAYRDYFVRWASDSDVRVHYHVDLLAVADVVQQRPDQRVAISALYPGEYHDPRVVEAVLGVQDEALRWFDGRAALVLPAGGPATYVFPSGVGLNPALQPLAYLSYVGRNELGAADLTPWLDIYLWNGAGIDLPSRDLRAGEQLLLLSAQLGTDPLLGGKTAELVTAWQVIGLLPTDRDAVVFAQLLDLQGNVVAQQDRLDAPSWNWHVGDQFAQLLLLSLPHDLEPGSYRVITGVYTVADRVDAVLAGHEPDPGMPRLPISIDGEPAGDAIELPAVEVVTDAG